MEHPLIRRIDFLLLFRLLRRDVKHYFGSTTNKTVLDCSRVQVNAGFDLEWQLYFASQRIWVLVHNETTVEDTAIFVSRLFKTE